MSEDKIIFNINILWLKMLQSILSSQLNWISSDCWWSLSSVKKVVIFIDSIVQCGECGGIFDVWTPE